MTEKKSFVDDVQYTKTKSCKSCGWFKRPEDVLLERIISCPHCGKPLADRLVRFIRLKTKHYLWGFKVWTTVKIAGYTPIECDVKMLKKGDCDG